MQIARLREKLKENPANPQYVKTVRGCGYMLASAACPTT
jgi:DNA-binding response OmpR family regulator